MEGEKTRVVVVGAGLAGCMTALLLARRKTGSGDDCFAIDVLERRPDPRGKHWERDLSSPALGAASDALRRSINLALSHRGECALEKAGLLSGLRGRMVGMPRRAIHGVDGAVSTHAYGSRGECIWSVRREDLLKSLLDALSAEENVRLRFQAHVSELRVRRDTGETSMRVQERGEAKTEVAQTVIGADGAYSRVRDAMLRVGRSDFSREFISHQYKELEIPAGPAGEWQLPLAKSLHIWPRHDFMLIALPNADGSFTCTLFAQASLFAHLDTLSHASDAGLEKWFSAHFPDATPLLKDLPSQYRSNPRGSLVTIRCRPWHFKHAMLLVGDAAHAVLPFYGQGMNAAFEDALLLDETLDECGGDLATAIPKFAALRAPQTDALADLSLSNYREMRHHTASAFFRASKAAEAVLHRSLPAFYTPLYTLIAFSRTPYHLAVQKHHSQAQTLKIAATLTLLAAALLAAHANRAAITKAIRHWVSE